MKTLVTACLMLLALIGKSQNKTYKFYYDKLNTSNPDFKFKQLLENSNGISTFRSLMEKKDMRFFGEVKIEASTLVNGILIPERDTAILNSFKIKAKYIEDSLNNVNNAKLSTKNVLNNKPYVLKNFNQGVYYFTFKLKFYKDTNYITAPLENFDWQLINETKTIANKICKKATCTWMDRNYTAWYCPTIPISDGPYKFTGLPGIILEIYDDEAFSHYRCTAIETENISTTITLPTTTTDLITMKKNANKALLKMEELNRSKNAINNNVFGGMESSSFNIFLIERSWLKNKFKD